jgi:LysR family transcriptional regulator, nitrogen assimilation regulatory protein
MVREGDAGFSGVGFHRNVNHQAARRSPWAKSRHWSTPPEKCSDTSHGAGNRLALPKVVSFDRLEGLDLVIPSRRHRPRRILDDAAAEAGFSLKPRLEIDTLSAICEVVATTDLLTVLPGIVLHSALSAGRIRAHRLRNPSIVRSVAWATNPRRSMSAAMSAVMDIIAEDLTKAATSASRLVRR